MISHLQVNAWDILNGFWIGQSRQVSGLLAQGLGLDDTAHDLAGPGLGDILDKVDLVGVSDWAQNLAHVSGDLLCEFGRLGDAISENDEGHDLLALDFIGLADDGCLCDLGVRNGCGLNLCVGDSVSGYLQHIINSALDPPVAILVAGGLVSSQVCAGLDLPVHIPVLLLVPDFISEEGTEHGRPGGLLDDVAAVSEWHGVGILIVDISVHAGQRECDGAGLLRCHGQWGDDVASGLSLPPGIDDWGLVCADVLSVPDEGFRIQGLAHRCQNSDGGQVVLLHKGLAGLHEHPDCGGCGVEYGYAVLLNDGPPAAQIREVRRAFVENAGSAKAERAVDHVGVSGDPSAVCCAPEYIVIVNIQNPGGCLSGTDGIAAMNVLDTLGLSGGSGGVQNEQPVLWIKGNGLALCGLASCKVIVEDIASLCHGHCDTGSLDDYYLLYRGSALHGLIHIGLEGQWLSAPVEAVCCDDNLGFGIIDPAGQAAGGESGEHDGVNGSDLGACQHGDGQLWDHGQVGNNSVALLDADTLESVGHLVDLSVELVVGDGPVIAHRLADEVVGNLVPIRGLGMPVYGVKGYVDLAAGEPLEVGLAGVVKNLGVGLEPIGIGLGHLIPEVNVIIRAPLAHLGFSLKALLLHPLICVGVLNNPLWGVENPGFFLQSRCLCCVSQFYTSLK